MPFDYGNGTYQDPMDPDATAASQDVASMQDPNVSGEGFNSAIVSEMDETNLVNLDLVKYSI